MRRNSISKRPAARREKITDLNTQLFAGKPIAEVESFTLISNDNKFEVEAFLTKPLRMTATSKHPLIVNIHGGPHGQNGPAFNFKNQVYAARGFRQPGRQPGQGAERQVGVDGCF